MTDKDTKTSTLKLGFGNSSPAKELRPDVVMQKSSIRGVRKTFTVAVKKTRTINSTRSAEDSKISQEFKDVFDDKGGLTESERSARINALKSASEETPEEIKQSRKKIGLEDSLINKSTAPEVVEKLEEVLIEKPVLEEPKVEDSKEETVTPLKKPLKAEEEEAADKNAKKVLKTDFKPPVVKSKWEDTRAKPKINLGLLMSSKAEDEVESTRSRSLASIKRAREKAKRHEQRNNDEPEKFSREVIVPEVITVQELANRMAERTTDVVRELMKLGMIATANQSIDADSAELIISAFGHKIKRVSDSDVENILNYSVDLAENLSRRAPVVTVMGHVDHGKTSLLDALKSTDVAAGEAGGITQHIGAYQVTLANGEHITFLDTPGHEAFTAMRSRGAKVTDIVVLVVAADDGIMAQTVEAINHAKAANVPIIVAINKIDKEGADPSRVRTELLSHGLVAEELGGDIIVVEVSAKKRLNLEQLEESILLQAEMLDLKANYSSAASGTVIEAKIDKNRGVIATLLVQRGTLKLGDIVVAGASYGRVRAINDDKFKPINEAYPSMPVEILGLAEAPRAGEQFAIVDNEKQARDIAEFRHKRAKDLRTAVVHHGSLEELFARASSTRNKELALIIKGDVQGSVEAIAASLMKIVSSEIKVKILHAAVGGITESDISLAKASGSIIIGFNVRAGNHVREMAESEKIEIRYYSVIYDVVDDIKAAMTGMLSPVMREQYTGTVEIRRVFNISKYGKIAGCYVTQGIIKRGSKVRLLRDNIVIHEGKLKTLKRLKDDVKEVKEAFECGIAIENYEDIKERDILEVFEIIEEKQTL